MQRPLLGAVPVHGQERRPRSPRSHALGGGGAAGGPAHEVDALDVRVEEAHLRAQHLNALLRATPSAVSTYAATARRLQRL
jgi:hypothetical protein